MRVLVSELVEKVGQKVKLYLTLDVLRNQKHLQFLLAHDNSGAIQLVVVKSQVSQHEDISQLLMGSCFIVEGLCVEAHQSKTFGVEIQVETIEIVSKAQAWPITEESAINLRFDYRVVDLKTQKSQLMLKLRSAFEQGCREYLLSRGMTEIHTPKLMGTASESGSQVFKVKYFDTYAYLAQSPQFFKEAGIASGLEGVFEIAPVFRAEESRSSRHLTEFTGLDVESAWLFKVEEVMKLEEGMMVSALAKLDPFKEQVKLLFNVELTTNPSIRYLSLDEAKDIIRPQISLSKDQDLPDEGERLLYEILGTELIFVYDYPIAKRPFYHMWDREKGTTKSFDLIFKGIEITSGSIREHRFDVVSQQALEKNVGLESISTYLDNFRYGCPPHGGFGLGVERVIAKLLELSSVKEASFMPRDPERLIP